MRLFRRTKTVKMRLGYQMEVDTRVSEHYEALKEGRYEKHVVEDCLQLVPDDGVFLDVGANIGFYTCAFASRAGFRGEIHAFEPVRANFEVLGRNVRLNGLEDRVRMHRMALGREAGELRMHVMPAGDVNNAVGDNMLAPHDREKMAREGWKEDTAPVARLDDWQRERGLGRCDLMKLDVEGAEPFVLEGGMEFIKSMRPIICGEFSPYWMAQVGKDFRDIRRIFEPLEYESFILRAGRYVPMREELMPETMAVPTYFLAPGEKARAVEGLNTRR